ncbi:Mis12-Mtw1 protein family-domain-containing protein [Chiua virens]|nr:Mis12-Mtw1 protein family-domain-containing protein [Chiua virens]
MNGTRGGLENPMAPVAKRKLPDDTNPLLTGATKRVKKDANSGKRKHIGEEQPGGLIIVRAPVQRTASPLNPPSSQPFPTTTTYHPSRQPSSSQPLPSTSTAPATTKPPSKKFKADSSRAPTGSKSRDVLATTREEPELDEDVRRMESETDHLRSRSRAKEAAHPSLQLPLPPNTPARRHLPDALQPLPESETPQIERNKLMREGPSIPRTPQSQTPSHSRRSSMSMRGKRISTSFENTGVISQPHASVNDSSFYKHIDCDLPEPQRARQLLVWSAARAASRPLEASSAKPPKPPSKSSSSDGKDPPLLDDRRKRILKTVQDDFIRMLAEKKIDTIVYSNGESDKTLKEGVLRPNEQNVKNRAREVTFQQHINRAQAESEAWSRVEQFYHQYATNSKADLEKRRQSLNPPASAKAKGKQRATSHELPDDDWSWLIPREEDLTDEFRDKVDLELIKCVMSSGPHPSMDQEIGDLQFKVDSLCSYVNSAVKATEVAEAELDYRFSLLSLAVSARSHSLPPPPSSSTMFSSYLPHTLRGFSHPPGEGPRDILRALSRIDKERPPGKIGDAARKAVREVQRAQEVGTGAGERRITGLALGVGATPRKVPGTPRRRDR